MGNQKFWDANYSPRPEQSFGVNSTRYMERLKAENRANAEAADKALFAFDDTDITGIELGVRSVAVVVRTNSFKCYKADHDIQTLWCIFTMVRPNGDHVRKNVKVGFCEDCDCYFIYTHDYNQLKKIGLILCEFIDSRMFYKYGIMKCREYNPCEWNETSKLYRLGYNVSAKNNLSHHQRWHLLLRIIEEGVMSCGEIYSFINNQIETKYYLDHMENAISKWSDDLDYLGRLPYD